MPKKIKLELDYDIGDFVFLVTDSDQERRIVTEIRICPSGVVYSVAHGTDESEHYAVELSDTKQVF